MQPFQTLKRVVTQLKKNNNEKDIMHSYVESLIREIRNKQCSDALSQTTWLHVTPLTKPHASRVIRN